jgi:hypothetical protein
MAERINAPPATVPAGGCSPCTSQTHNGFNTTSAKAISMAGTTGTCLAPSAKAMIGNASCTSPINEMRPTCHSGKAGRPMKIATKANTISPPRTMPGIISTSR